MLRSLIPVLGAAILCGAGISAAPAKSAPAAPAIGTLAGEGEVQAEQAQYYGPRPYYYGRPHGPRYRYRPAPPPYYFGPPRVFAPFPFAPPPPPPPRYYGPRYYW